MFTRLYPEFQPTNYKLLLDIDRETLTFSGTVEVTGNLTKQASVINLHSKELTITKAVLNGKEVTFNTHEFDVLSVEATSALSKGAQTIQLEFTGNVHTENMSGLYESRFKHNDEPKNILVTQFESHHAREVFPCIDEPEAKATFDVTLVTHSNDPVIGNMPVASQSTDNGVVTTTFETTPIMSTYLVAFAYGDIHYQETITDDGVTIRTYGSVAQPKSWLNYANNEAKAVLEFFTNYFQTPFPLKKLDQLALPDFDAGAMENWGLVTYREIALLSDPKNRSLETEQYVSLVVAHELSHQWFGNLVTMQWWDDLWLNESFASMMEHLALDALHPDWHQWEDYTSQDVVSTSARDIFSDVQAVSIAVENPELITTLFDPAIVYAKGGRLLKMLREYIGDAAFRDGLKNYFTNFAYKNTSKDDLWESLSAASGKDIKALMNPWLVQSGMPVLSINQVGTSLQLTQQRFVLDKANDTQCWPIPLLSTTKLPVDTVVDTQTTVELDSTDYVYINQHGSGHYLTRYVQPDHYQAIQAMLRADTVPTEGKITFFNDQLLLAKRGDVAMTDILKLVASNASEQRDSVWNLMAMSVGAARALVEGDEPTDLQLRKFFGNLVLPLYESLGWIDNDSDDPNVTHLRATAISSRLAAKDPSAVAEALAIYQQHKSDISQIPANRRAVVLVTAVLRADDHDAVIADLLAQHETTDSSDIQLDITRALTRTKNPSDVALFIDKAFGDGGFVRQQDFARWIALLTSNHHVREQMWDYIESEWDYVTKELKGSKSYDYFPIYLSRGLNTPDWQKRFSTFFKPKLHDPLLERNIKVALHDIDARVAWRSREETAIKEWVNSQKLTQ